MNSVPDWRKMNLSEETLFDLEKALPYWLQYPPGDFIQSIVHSMREEVSIIETLLGFIQHPENADGISPKPPSDFQRAQDNYELIIKRIGKLKRMLTIAMHYGINQSPNDNR